jgi:hypothetical protein
VKVAVWSVSTPSGTGQSSPVVGPCTPLAMVRQAYASKLSALIMS